MKAKYKRMWLKALRSGEYVQGREALCTVTPKGTHKFCCLGVLINEVEGFDYVPGVDDPSLAPLFNSVWEAAANGDTSCLPEEFADKVELEWLDQEHLIEMNDGDRSGFKRIANWIERNL